ncbi:MAG: hypothetical protein H0T46_12045 [Deltaproteobacteria bacterium]|nr:hypothetical protein [Deltaproteobacteria bacterium]
MKPARSILFTAALAACSSAKSTGTASDAPVVTPDAAPASAADLPKRVAASVCGALFRCCDDDLETYFGPYAANELLTAFKPRLPPADEPSCRVVLEEMLDIVPMGDWVRAVGQGTVTYEASVATGCLAALDGAACGQPARDALWDSKCFGFAPPVGGTEQRAWVTRLRGAGEACGPIRDGIGAAFYGTCDPRTSFCCYAEPGRTGCQYPFDAQNHPRTGTCAPVAPEGSTCASTVPVKLCASGSDCDADTLTCTSPIETPLAAGQTCIDDGFRTLGTCQTSFCDLFGSKRCEPLRTEGVACTGGYECGSGLCRERVCRPMDVCTGMATPPPPPIDAGTDAPIVTSTETCAAAPELASVSVASPLAGYASRVTGTLGAVNDYNPKTTAGLPPSCSVVYDARGKDIVYAITLQPGDRLKLRGELAGGKQVGLYLLDTCPGGSWPDFDGSGACGSNEYAAGFCGALGCDPATLTITYPTMIGGQPTQPAMFWVVVDEMGGDTATGFTVDWQLAH